uniref:Uncharacterized protein n=1 Tax=Clastoptera arizonana TaxID=38151 RepID=A0A1B6CRE4_9HEMI
MLSLRKTKHIHRSARNNQYIHSLKLKNLRSEVKRRLNISNRNLRKSTIAKFKATINKNNGGRNETSVRYKNTRIVSKIKINESLSLSRLPLDSLDYDSTNKHTRSFSKRYNDLASIFVPCDYSYELSLQKTWPSNYTHNLSLMTVLKKQNQDHKIMNIMKDSLDLVLGFCFSYRSEGTNLKNSFRRNNCIQQKLYFSNNDLDVFEESLGIEDLGNPAKPISLNETYNFKNDAEVNETLNYSSRHTNLSEKYNDLNIQDFIRPHLSPCKTRRKNDTRKHSRGLFTAKTTDLFFHTQNSFNNDVVFKVNRDHSYAKMYKEMMSKEKFLQSNNIHTNLFVNKESSPKQYSNPKRLLFDCNKEQPFLFGTRNKTKDVLRNEANILKDNIINTNRLKTPCHSHTATQNTSFLKELVLDTAQLYSMLCGIDPEDVGFYIHSRSKDPDQWAIEILDSINII